tara:strand:- start:183 stop:494 length:312 start_codon:yes stop_codon:yes gene_type:complete
MKCLTILSLKFLLLSNFVIAETIPTKSNLLKRSRDCLKDSQSQVCKELISEIEKLQVFVFEQNRFKCQSSLLGLQSEMIEAYFVKNSSDERISFMIPYVIKYC